MSGVTRAPRWLLRAENISKDVASLSVQDTGGSLVVLLYGKSVPASATPFKPFENVTAQVWLLRRDGTAQPRLGEAPVKAGVGSGGFVQEIMSFGFAPSAAQDLAGVVASVNGQLFVREIK